MTLVVALFLYVDVLLFISFSYDHPFSFMNTSNNSPSAKLFY
jgi:hypothetical protein